MACIEEATDEDYGLRINSPYRFALGYGVEVVDLNAYITNDVYSRFVEDGSFLRLKNITLGYTLPKKWTSKFYVSRLRVYATGQNLFCVTGYSGYDPEVSTAGSNPMTPGLDWGAYPKSKVFTFGLDIQF